MVDATPFRTPTFSCPRCPAALSNGELGFCERCHGVWIPEPALRDRVSRMQGQPLPQLRWEAQSRPPIACVACRAPMQTLLLFEVPIDRCAAHGVWFDRDELSTVLLQSQNVTVAAGVAVVATESGSSPVASTLSTAGDGLDVIGGVLEVVGALFSLF